VDTPKGSCWITQQFEDNGDMVIGYADMEKWLRVVDWCRNYKPDMDKLTVEAKKKSDERDNFYKKAGENK